MEIKLRTKQYFHDPSFSKPQAVELPGLSARSVSLINDDIPGRWMDRATGRNYFGIAPQLPRVGEQFITPDGRAYYVTLVEWRFDLNEVHLFCIEFHKKQPPPESAET